MMRYGAYIWTAAAAGWAVIAYLTGLMEAVLVTAACFAMAIVWLDIYDDN